MLRLAQPAIIAVTALLAFSLNGCAYAASESTPPGSSSPAPSFESDADALAAAEQALTAFFKVQNLIYQEGGEDSARLSLVATEALVDEASSIFSFFKESGWRQIGDSGFDNTTFQRTYVGKDATYQVVMTCVDFSGRSVVDSHGAEVDSSRIPDRQLFEVELKKQSEGESLILSDVTPRNAEGC